MKRALILGVLITTVAAGCATDVADKKFADTANSKSKPEAYCVRDTGSRIKVQEGKCLQSGRTYTRDELETTGAITPGEALRRLDPRIQ